MRQLGQASNGPQATVESLDSSIIHRTKMSTIIPGKSRLGVNKTRAGENRGCATGDAYRDFKDPGPAIQNRIPKQT